MHLISYFSSKLSVIFPIFDDFSVFKYCSWIFCACFVMFLLVFNHFSTVTAAQNNNTHVSKIPLWIIKPVASSCGKGIKVLTSLQCTQLPAVSDQSSCINFRLVFLAIFVCFLSHKEHVIRCLFSFLFVSVTLLNGSLTRNVWFSFVTFFIPRIV